MIVTCAMCRAKTIIEIDWVLQGLLFCSSGCQGAFNAESEDGPPVTHFWAENDKPLCGSDTSRGDSMQKVMGWVTCSACKSISIPKRSG